MKRLSHYSAFMVLSLLILFGMMFPVIGAQFSQDISD